MKDSILERVKVLYKKISQTDKEIDMCEKYIYCRKSDRNFIDLKIKNKNGQFIVKSRDRNYSKEYCDFFSSEYSREMRISSLRDEFLCSNRCIIEEKEIVGTVDRCENFKLNVLLLDHYGVEFCANVNQKSRSQNNRERFIRVFQNINKECDTILLNIYGLEYNSSHHMRVFKQIFKYNSCQEKPFGFIFFDFCGIGMSGDCVDFGDISFVNDAILVIKYLRRVYPEKKISIMSDCFGTNIASRVIADLNIDSVLSNYNFDHVWSVKTYSMTVPYVSTKDVKKDHNLITHLIMNVFSKYFRVGYMTKFSNIDTLEFIPVSVKISLIQARSPYFSLKDSSIISKVIKKIKEFIVIKRSDNFVSYSQTYKIVNAIRKNHHLLFFYSNKLNHDDVVFAFWMEKLNIISIMLSDKNKRQFGVMDIQLCHSYIKLMSRLKESMIFIPEELYSDIIKFIDFLRFEDLSNRKQIDLYIFDIMKKLCLIKNKDLINILKNNLENIARIIRKKDNIQIMEEINNV